MYYDICMKIQYVYDIIYFASDMNIILYIKNQWLSKQIKTVYSYLHYFITAKQKNIQPGAYLKENVYFYWLYIEF